MDGIIGVGHSSWLYNVYDWGIDVIKIIQSIENLFLSKIMIFITNMGSAYFYFPLLLLIFWCIDEKKGARLAFFIMLGAWLNVTCKFLLKQPRPYQLDVSVGRILEKTYGFPSAHAQMSLSFWFPLSLWYGKKNLFIAAILFSLLMGFSRLYLGVHFPTDLLGGWFLATVMLIIFLRFEDKIVYVLNRGGTRFQLICASIIAWFMNFLGDIRIGGIFLGFAIGYVLMLKKFPFSANALVKGKKPNFIILGIRFVIGLVVLIFLFWLQSLLILQISFWGDNYNLLSFISYIIIGFWVGAGAPWVFLHLNLACGPDDMV